VKIANVKIANAAKLCFKIIDYKLNRKLSFYLFNYSSC
jgi:hypothetical protein